MSVENLWKFIRLELSCDVKVFLALNISMSVYGTTTAATTYAAPAMSYAAPTMGYAAPTMAYGAAMPAYGGAYGGMQTVRPEQHYFISALHRNITKQIHRCQTHDKQLFTV